MMTQLPTRACTRAFKYMFFVKDTGDLTESARSRVEVDSAEQQFIVTQQHTTHCN
jgi:hypothetical protein